MVTIIFEINRPIQWKPGIWRNKKPKSYPKSFISFRCWWLFFAVTVSKRPLPFIAAPRQVGLPETEWAYEGEYLTALRHAEKFK